MKTVLITLLAVQALFASNIEELSLKTKQMNENRINVREVLTMDVDIREFRRSNITRQRNVQSVVVSKMIKMRDKDRG